MILSKLKEISAGIDCKNYAPRASKNWESRQSESHFEKSKTRCMEVKVLNQCP